MLRASTTVAVRAHLSAEMLELVHALVGQLSRMRQTVLEAARLAHRLGQLVRREATAALRAVHRLTPVCAEQTSQHVIDGVWHHVQTQRATCTSYRYF